MNLRRSLLGIASIALTIFLVVLLIRISKIDLRVTLQQLRSISWLAFAKLLFLNGLLVYLSTEKWLSIDAAWRRSSDTVPSRATAFAHTSAGLALGILLPVQLAMSTARTFGTHVHGRALKRGTAGTIFEQGFDLLTVGFLAVASGLTRFYKGGAMMWSLLAAAATAVAFLAVGPSVRVMQWLGTSSFARTAEHQTKAGVLLRRILALGQSGLLDTGLARRLVMLSTLRFSVVVLMSVQTAEAIGLHIPVWQMAAAIPFVVFASVIALTPGGLGINELTSVSALRVFGTPLGVAAQWAVANRVLVALSYFSVAACAAIVLWVMRIRDPVAPNLAIKK